MCIKKRPICGGLLQSRFALLGNRLELVELLLNCELRSAFSDRAAVIRTFAITSLGSRLQLVEY